MIVTSTFTTGELMSMLTYCMNILGSLMMLSMVFVMITMSVANANRVAEVLNEKATIVNPENPVMEVPNGDIDFDHVNFAYKKDAEEFVLEDIDLHIKRGETIGVLGGTGSAKSTLVNLISRLYDVTEGKVRVGDIDVRDYDLKSSVIRYLLFYRTMSFSQEPSMRTCAGEVKMRRTRSAKRLVNLPVQTSLSSVSRTAMIPISSREAAMFPVDSVRDFVLPEPC